MAFEVVTLAERYKLEDPIASGGMATVWRARDEVLARTVAVKILEASLAADREFLERFRREALAAARLTHPSIVAIYDTGEEAGEVPRHYIVMEYCGGGTLRELFAREGRLAPDRAVGTGVDICQALTYAHRHGVVHRDVKPGNVLVSDAGSLKVGDFGIAKAAFDTGGSDLTTTGSILGTVTYISPEQAQGHDPDARSDLYALGVVLYEAVAGRPPFQAESQLAVAMKHIKEQPLPLRSLRADTPRQLEAVVMKALAKSPESRFESAEEMSSALMAAADGRVTATFRAPAPVPRDEHVAYQRPRNDYRWVVMVLALIAVAGLIAWGLASLATSPEPEANPGTQNPPSTVKEPAIPVASVHDFDPEGGSEHPEEALLAADGNTSTSWSTETYNDPLQLIKPGVGLWFDLGSPREVARVGVVSPTPGYSFELRSADTVGPDQNSFQLRDSVTDAAGSETVDMTPARARYWLLWITDLPGGGGGSASIAEVRFFGP